MGGALLCLRASPLGTAWCTDDLHVDLAHWDPAMWSEAEVRAAWATAAVGRLADLRARVAAELHVERYSYARIAAELGVSRGRAQQLVARGADVGTHQ